MTAIPFLKFAMHRLAAGDQSIKEFIRVAEARAKVDLIFDSEDFGPVFRSDGPASLQCRICSNVLVSGYSPERFVALHFRCYVCGGITNTPEWRILAPFPATTKVFDGIGIGTVDPEFCVVARDLVLTSRKEYDRVTAQLSVASRSEGSHISIETQILAIEELLKSLHPRYDKLLARTIRLSATQELDSFKGSWLLWALNQLKEPAAERRTVLWPAEQVALSYVHSCDEIIRRWNHHPLFQTLGSSLVEEFHHARTMFTFASYMSDIGNILAVTDTHRYHNRNHRSPDLYLNLGPQTKLSLEIKALQSLNPYPLSSRAPALSPADLKKINDAANQFLDHEHGGIVVLGATVRNEAELEALKSALDSAIRRENVSGRIAAVALAAHFAYPSLHQRADGGTRVGVSTSMWLVENGKFRGKRIPMQQLKQPPWAAT